MSSPLPQVTSQTQPQQALSSSPSRSTLFGRVSQRSRSFTKPGGQSRPTTPATTTSSTKTSAPADASVIVDCDTLAASNASSGSPTTSTSPPSTPKRSLFQKASSWSSSPDASNATTASSSAKASPSIVKKSSSSGRPPRFRRRSFSIVAKNNKKKSKKNMLFDGDMTLGGPPENVIQWMEIECPDDVMPKILAYCGPQMMQTLMATNRYWFYLLTKQENDGLWRGICEGLYKWKEGRDEIPVSWKDYYCTHPCVPMDYLTIPNALAVATTVSKKRSSRTLLRSNSMGNKNKEPVQDRSVHILLRPGKHYLKESLVVSAAAGVKVTIETMEMPADRYYSQPLAFVEQEFPQSHHSLQQPKSRGSPFRNIMGCKSRSSVDTSDTEASFYDSDSSDPVVVFNAEIFNNINHNYLHRHRLSTRSESFGSAISISSNSGCYPASITFNNTLFAVPPKYPERATIVLRTRRQNEPVIKVRQGNFKIAKIDLEHASHGVDIWNGNAAVQIQPPLTTENQPVPVIPRPVVELDHVGVSSHSGRGLVCLDGGNVTLHKCMIYDCAATGLYVGGPGSAATLTSTDVVRNGIGSRLPPSRAPRVTSGHSGVYLEQGTCSIQGCNISLNHLTGISAVSPENAVLLLNKSDLVANGQGNLELPSPGTVSYDLSDISNDNNLAPVGRPCLRSNLELPRRPRASAAF